MQISVRELDMDELWEKVTSQLGKALPGSYPTISVHKGY